MLERIANRSLSHFFFKSLGQIAWCQQFKEVYFSVLIWSMVGWLWGRSNTAEGHGTEKDTQPMAARKRDRREEPGREIYPSGHTSSGSPFLTRLHFLIILNSSMDETTMMHIVSPLPPNHLPNIQRQGCEREQILDINHNSGFEWCFSIWRPPI